MKFGKDYWGIKKKTEKIEQNYKETLENGRERQIRWRDRNKHRKKNKIKSRNQREKTCQKNRNSKLQAL